jgi:succinoglycan biosynthesis protein ExoO
MRASGRSCVSVAMPCYNNARFIGRAVRSAAAQEGVDLAEIVVVDDGSTDGSLAVLRELQREIPALKIIESERNNGVGAARNRGLEATTGDWVAVLDSDDAFAPGRLAHLVAVAEEQGVDMIADCLILYDLEAGAEAPGQQHPHFPFRLLDLPDFLAPDPLTGLDLGLLKPMGRRSLIDEGRWHYDPTMRHASDFDLYFRLLRQGARFGWISEPLYYFSSRIGALTGRFSPGSVTRVNYLAIAAHARQLAEEMRSSDREDAEELVVALERRAHRATSQNRVYGWTALRTGSWSRLRSWLRNDPRNGRELLNIITAKLKGHRGLPV